MARRSGTVILGFLGLARFRGISRSFPLSGGWIDKLCCARVALELLTAVLCLCPGGSGYGVALVAPDAVVAVVCCCRRMHAYTLAKGPTRLESLVV